MVPSRQGGAEAPRPTGGSPWPSIVHTSESTVTCEPQRHARRRPRMVRMPPRVGRDAQEAAALAAEVALVA